MPTGIYLRKPFTKEHKKHLREGHKGINTWTKGKKLSEETKKKIRKAMKGRRPQDYKNWHPSYGMKGKRGWNKGLKRWWDSPSFPKGHKPWNKGKKGVMPIPWNKGKHYKGKPHTKEWIEKVRIALIKRADRIGRKKYLRPKHNTHWKYREWRTNVYRRDNYKCWVCEATNLNAHHLKSWAKYPRLRYKITNGLTLCEFCHKTYA